jgi:hypothetical protein
MSGCVCVGGGGVGLYSWQTLLLLGVVCVGGGGGGWAWWVGAGDVQAGFAWCALAVCPAHLCEPADLSLLLHRYAKFIIDHYDNLPGRMIFAHAHDKSWHQRVRVRDEQLSLSLMLLWWRWWWWWRRCWWLLLSHRVWL